tara:strand:+ start:263 stop:721 length:459 start_codon:yes stop_codon:yes gene_type:complete
MYVKLSNGAIEQYPYTLGDLRRENSNTSFPKRPSAELLTGYDMYSVTRLPVPTYDKRTQFVQDQATPVLNDGVWEMGYDILSNTDEQIAEYDNAVSLNARSLRNSLLEDTDWMALSDVTMSTEMTTYRQALRDITAHENWPNLANDDWPTKS